MKILVGCEMSDQVTMAFRALGHEAYSCDLLPSMHNSPYHWVGDVIEAAYNWRWDMGLFFPPCTYLTNSGSKWLYIDGIYENGRDEERWIELEKAAFLFNKLLAAPIKKICVENPIMHSHATARILWPYSQIVQPWMFGHGEIKKTAFWLKNLPLLKPTNVVEGREARVHKESPATINGLTRAMRRSMTFPGIAAAMAAQWGE